MSMSANKKYQIKITGIVQGVGFRPFIYTKAKSLSLCGWVSNVSDGVIIEVEGKVEDLDVFLNSIRKDAPLLSLIKNISISEAALVGYSDFQIRKSTKSEEKSIYISPDVSICEDCKREMFNPGDRRHLYPFINCTNCGPRFTIVKDVPYDRVHTTMDKFPMCEKCAEEYNDPSDRIYHAQPVACYDCGPKLVLMDNKLNEIAGSNLVGSTIKLLLEGKIIAIKGLGGYHLACDANNSKAVKTLRERKIRDDKPFAVMVKDSEAAERYCYVNKHEKSLLESQRRPIVLLAKREDFSLPEQVAPGNPNLGIMLPYTPVHELLFADLGLNDHRMNSSTLSSQPSAHISQLSALVMTSGNRSNEPIYYKDDEAFQNLKEIADYFLTNDRDIYIRTDDSVTRSFKGKEFLIRRSRGYVPMPITCDILKDMDSKKLPSVLACGGELKNTFCMNKGNEFFLSHHIGDLENFETLTSFEEGIDHFSNMFRIDYDIIAHDLHPEYLSTKYSTGIDTKRKLPIQHHHAHIASCMAENNLKEDVIGVAFDGTAYGEDGNIWGGEIFIGNYSGFRRAGHLDYVEMPGGEAAIKEPWRMAIGYLHKYQNSYLKPLDSDMGIRVHDSVLLDSVEKSKIALALQMLDKGLNCPLTSSIGRLFDAVAALTGVRSRINYEGQAAIELEYIANMNISGTYDFSIINGKSKGEAFIISMEDTITGILDDLRSGVSKDIISSKFHETVAGVILKSCVKIKNETGINNVALSGGVFQNMTLLTKTIQKLEGSGFAPYIHSKVPTNDAGIALGQAAISVFKLL